MGFLDPVAQLGETRSDPVGVGDEVALPGLAEDRRLSCPQAPEPDRQDDREDDRDDRQRRGGERDETRRCSQLIHRPQSTERWAATAASYG